MEPDEEVAHVPGFPGYYATTEGRIYSTKSNKYLAQRLDVNHVLRVNLSQDHKVHSIAVHLLVIRAFKGPADPGYQAVHIDEDIYNNRPGNLKYKHRRDIALDIAARKQLAS
jgi:hypothetical protein